MTSKQGSAGRSRLGRTLAMASILAMAPMLLTLAFGATAQAQDGSGTQPQPQREWTFLVYLNGHNSLDSFGILNLKDMEKVGSTDRVNVVVQWASYKNPKTKRLFVQKNAHPSGDVLASKVVEELPTVDMGDYHNFVDFVKWGMKNFPAKHYFVNVWNHGGGWHLKPNALGGAELHPLDISWDDRTGHFIKTEELGMAMNEIATAMGHKVDVYGSDACLMAMAEVAGEMSGSVETYVGSQEVEPGAGWPYDKFLAAWNSLTDANSQAVGKALAHAYVASYQGGSNGSADATMSVFDMSKLAVLETSVQNFASALAKMSTANLQKALKLAQAAQSFSYNDYVDLIDFAASMGQDASFRTMTEIADVKAAATAFVSYNEATKSFHGANGLSIWLPTDADTFGQYSLRYQGLAFNKATGWMDFLKAMFP